MIIDLGLVLAGYLCGSLASAVVVCRLLGLPDPRLGGSGNPGATNVLRLGGRPAAALTLIGDVVKGVVPVLAALHLSSDPQVVAPAAGLAAFAGHLYPVFFGFRGGKGVATAFGVAAALSLAVLLAMALAWGVVTVATRYASAGSLAAGLVAPVMALVLEAPPASVVAFAVMWVLLTWRHRGNLRRIIDGTESRIGRNAGGAA